MLGPLPNRSLVPLWALPLAVFAAHGSAFGAWLIDDAGISFSYARSFAQGFGLVAQPGAAPVEGYSNPLWVALYSALYRLGLMGLPWTPKAVALLLTGATFWLIARTLHAEGLPPAAPLVTAMALALNTSFVVWSVSGLEGPLLGLLVVALLRSLTRVGRDDRVRWTALLPSAGWVAALALTRPDAAAFGVVPPLVSCLQTIRHRERVRKLGQAVAAYVAVLLLAALAVTLLRLWYFGDALPNTYRVKGGPSGATVRALLLLEPHVVAQFTLVARAWVSGLGGWWLVTVVAGTVALAAARGLRPAEMSAALLTLAGAAVFALLPPDWMGEFRFAFGFLVAAALLVSLVGDGLVAHFAPARRQVWSTVLIVVWLGTVTAASALRTPRFARAPTVPLSLVADSVGHRFNRIAERLGVRDGSILTPDVGGSLLASRLRVYDLGQLTDPVIARTMNTDKRAFHDYVFATARPTFIMTHEVWTLGAEFERDPRFERDYVALDVYEDPTVLALSGRRLQSGVFVRRDAVSGKEETAAAISAELRATRLVRQR